MSDRTKGVLFASVTTIFWGFLAVALKAATGFMDPLTIVWFRFLTAFIILLAYFALTRPEYLRILYQPPLYLIAGALGLGINYLAYLYGLKFTTAGTAQVIIQLGPILLGMVGLFFFHEKISLRQALGFVVAGTGLFLFYRDRIGQFSHAEELFNMGVLWVVVGAMSWVVYAAFQKVLVRKYPTQQLNLFLFGLPTFLFLPFTRLEEFLSLSALQWLLLLYLGINTLIAYGSLAMAFKYLEASKVSIIVTMNPLITFLSIGLLTSLEVSWVGSERMTFEGYVAAVMVILGAVMAIAVARPENKLEVKDWINKLRFVIRKNQPDR
ncbi:MAG: DMT family transporter [Bacteroidales bacterium]